ncbi:hypothetical protein LC040_02125 [Bacillus tianshenii]|nr:hypothetical protein LC040_02125 [Bacillus tianshenii]
MTENHLSRSEIDRLLGVDTSKRPATHEEFLKINEEIKRVKANHQEINYKEMLKKLGLEDVQVISREELLESVKLQNEE